MEGHLGENPNNGSAEEKWMVNHDIDLFIFQLNRQEKYYYQQTLTSQILIHCGWFSSLECLGWYPVCLRFVARIAWWFCGQESQGSMEFISSLFLLNNLGGQKYKSFLKGYSN